MTIQVQAPDGTTLSFPDTANAEQIHKIMIGRFGSKPSVFDDFKTLNAQPATPAAPSGPAPAGSSISDMVKNGFPGPDITARARTGIGLPAEVPPMPPTSQFTSDVTKKAREHPEGLPLAIAAGSLPAGAAAVLAKASPEIKALFKAVLEGVGIGGTIAGTEHYLK